MNLNDLRKWLIENNVPKYHYVINELGAGEADGVGFINNYWCTYYSERGQYESIKKYKSEDEACLAFERIIRRVMERQHSTQLSSMD